jgi:hypothetical protein
MIVLGIGAAALGALAAVLLAVTGARTLTAGAAFTGSVISVFRLLAAVAGAASIVGLVTNRRWPVAVILCAGMVMLGYVAGYFYAQGLGLWYPTR